MSLSQQFSRKFFSNNTSKMCSAVVFLSLSSCVSAYDGVSTTYDPSTEITVEELNALIEQKGKEYNKSNVIFTESLSYLDEEFQRTYEITDQEEIAEYTPRISNDSFDRWYANSYNTSRANAYRDYLVRGVGEHNVPPLSQLLLTARSWKKCGHSQYQVPPKRLWKNMLPTLRLFADLKSSGALPESTIIRSGYRSPSLNRCAGGARGSKHLTNGAIDLWVPGFYNVRNLKLQTQDRVCRFWRLEGKQRRFGLGIYHTGSIHIDTQGFRKWTNQRRFPSYSSCVSR